MLKKSKQLVDDLFEKSSMSFGEHLEELRKALTMAFIWLGIGTAVGLYFGTSMVKFVEAPLRAKLSEFKIEQAKRLFFKANGVAPSPKMAKWMETNGVVPERVFIDPKELTSPNSETVAEASLAVPESPPSESTDKTVKPHVRQSTLNPWKDVDVARLERLQPLLLWRPIENRLLTFNVLDGFMIWLN